MMLAFANRCEGVVWVAGCGGRHGFGVVAFVVVGNDQFEWRSLRIGGQTICAAGRVKRNGGHRGLRSSSLWLGSRCC